MYIIVLNYTYSYDDILQQDDYVLLFFVVVF